MEVHSPAVKPQEVVRPSEFVHKETLPNGLRVLVHEMPWAQSVTSQLIVPAGPRYETERTVGAAHFLEHMFYEGSTTYPSTTDLSRAIEARGGFHYAHTDKEYALYQAKLPPENAEFSTQFLRDFVFNPQMSDAAVQKEKGIIAAELREFIDDPSKYRWDLLSQFVWKGHPLGYSTLGTFDTLQNMTREDLLAYHAMHYRPDTSVLVVAGNIPAAKAIDMAMRDFGDLPAGNTTIDKISAPTFIDAQPRVLIENKDLQQAQIMLAFSAEDRGQSSPLRPQIDCLATLLHNEIFNRLVYERGMSYTAGCAPWLVLDSGLLVLSAGVGAQHTGEAVDIMVDAVNNLQINDETIHRAKQRMKSGFMSLADTDHYAHFISNQELFTGTVKSPQQLKNDIDAINTSDLVDLRGKIFSHKNAALVILGPIAQERTSEYNQKLQFA